MWEKEQQTEKDRRPGARRVRNTKRWKWDRPIKGPSGGSEEAKRRQERRLRRNRQGTIKGESTSLELVESQASTALPGDLYIYQKQLQ
jgi:hypothetical protein